MIQLQNITKKYKGKKIDTDALNGITMSMDAGEYICIYGKSGCGKTTLLNILGGMDQPTSGTYRYGNRLVSDFSATEMAAFRNEKVGYIFQSFHLLPAFTALENVAMPLGYAGIRKKTRNDRGKEMLERVGLANKSSAYPAELSGGEQQRVAIARALVTKPTLILCDEPTGNLDEKNAEGIIQLIESMHEKDKILVLVTHDSGLRDRANTIYHMQDGRLVGLSD